MDWANERYVRLYVRDTKTWCKLGWEGQCVFSLLLRKADRSGLLDDVRDAGDVLVILRNGMPLEIAEAGLGRLLELGVIESWPAGLVAPNYIEAQETPQSNAQRNREWRAKRRDLSRRNVTECNETSRERDAARRGETSRDSVPCRAVPNRAVLDPPCSPPAGGKLSKVSKPAKRKHQLPDSWEPTDTHRAKCVAAKLDCNAEVEKFRNHHLARGNLMVDWDRAFWTWLSNAIRNGWGEPSKRVPSKPKTDNLVLNEKTGTWHRKRPQPPSDELSVGDDPWSLTGGEQRESPPEPGLPPNELGRLLNGALKGMKQ